MEIIRLYTGDDGESHFATLQVSLRDGGPIGFLSEREPATGIIFRETGPEYDYSWHPAPRRQYIIMLDGSVDVTIGDGTTRSFGTGDVLLVEDTTGRGHVSRAVDGKARRSIFVTLD